MSPTLVSISCLLFLAVYVSAQQYNYDVDVKVNKKSPPVNGEMQIKIKACTSMSKIRSTSCKEVTAVPKKYLCTRNLMK